MATPCTGNLNKNLRSSENTPVFYASCPTQAWKATQGEGFKSTVYKSTSPTILDSRSTKLCYTQLL